jgi:hypothetical protein
MSREISGSRRREKETKQAVLPENDCRKKPKRRAPSRRSPALFNIPQKRTYVPAPNIYSGVHGLPIRRRVSLAIDKQSQTFSLSTTL